MPGTPATSPVFGAPRYDDADDATFAEQLNPVTDTFDSLACRTDDPRLTDARNPLPNSITLASIANGTITGAKLAAATITEANMAPGSVGSTEIIDGTIQNVDMAANSVDSRVIAPGGVVTAVIADGAVTQAKLATNVVQSQVVTGDLIASIATTRAGCVLCDGKAYSRTDPTYAALFALIGTKYGPGDGATTYNVPNLTGTTVVMADPGGARLPANRPAVGAVFGVETYGLAHNELASHNHGGNTGGLSPGYSLAHAHQVNSQLQPSQVSIGQAYSVFAQPGYGIFQFGGAPWGTDNCGALDHLHTIAMDGNGQAHQNMPPSFAANIFVKL
jgi:microcystin-dependent protein